MQQLQNNCRVSKLTVHPQNWQAKNASTKDYWYVSYRFYDDNLQQKKQVMIQGMNHLENLVDRQNLTKILIENELHNLQKGYNPITNKFHNPPEEDTNSDIVSPKTKFCEALRKAQSTLNLECFTKYNMKFIVEKICNTAGDVVVDGQAIDKIDIYCIKKRHIRALMNKLAENNHWSAYSWNNYRSYLMMLYKELSEYDAVESNIPRDISKRKIIKKVRTILSDEERKKVREYLQKNNPRFWLFLNMFFHSGARISEFFRLKLGDINLKKQIIKVTIKKGRQYAEIIKPIKIIAVPFWEEYLRGFEDENLYLMGKGLYPSEKNIRYDQINHRWQKVKNKLGIKADFYSEVV